MSTRAETLYNKWMNGEKHGYLSDEEVNELSAMLKLAMDLSKAFAAGTACDNYFVQLWYNIEQVRNARK